MFTNILQCCLSHSLSCLDCVIWTKIRNNLGLSIWYHWVRLLIWKCFIIMGQCKQRNILFSKISPRILIVYFYKEVKEGPQRLCCEWEITFLSEYAQTKVEIFVALHLELKLGLHFGNRKYGKSEVFLHVKRDNNLKDESSDSPNIKEGLWRSSILLQDF